MKHFRILAAILALIMVVSLAACTEPAEGNGTTDDVTTNGVTTDSTTTDTTPTEGDNTTDTPAGTTDTSADTSGTVTPDDGTVPEDELFVEDLGGIFTDPTFTNGTSMFTKVNHGDVKVEGGKLKVTTDESVDQVNLQEWEHALDFASAGTYKVYFRGTVEGDLPIWAIFKIGSDTCQIKLSGRLVGIDQVMEINYDGVANKSFQFAAGWADGTSATIIFDYIQVVRVD